MKTPFAFALAASLLSGAALAETINFDHLTPGAPPPGWTATQTGSGEARWAVVADASAPSKPNVLEQSGQARFPICIKNGVSLKDGFIAVKFKPLSGKQDQAGGLLWRCRDKDNYYVARANALEDNLTLYHTIKGKRTETKRLQTKVAPNAWHSLRVDFHGPHFKVTFDRKVTLRWTDNTFPDAGQVGLWTKADSVTRFDDFTYGAK